MSRSISASSRMLEISWLREGRRPLIQLLIFSPEPGEHRSVEATALIDTGATTSAITADLARQLGLRVTGKRPMASAHSEEIVNRYIFRIGLLSQSDNDAPPRAPYVFDAVDGFEIRAAFDFNAILGMDILGQCDLTMERTGRCRLRVG